MKKNKHLYKFIKEYIKIPFYFFQRRLLSFRKPYLPEKLFQIIDRIYKEKRALLWPDEFLQIFYCVKAVENVEGAIVEVGVAGGGSARIIAEANSKKSMFLCNPFAGLPGVSSLDNEFYAGEYRYSLENVQQYLRDYTFTFLKGIFPNQEAVNRLSNTSFSFVHLDVDLYQSTKDCLEFFYPRMTKEGMILSHDYSNTAGVKKAFDEFLSDKLENILELSTSQCLLLKGNIWGTISPFSVLKRNNFQLTI